MKKWVLILGIVLSFNVYAEDVVTEVNHWQCGTNCRATLYSDGLFKVEQEDKKGPQAVMYNSHPTTDENGTWNLNTSDWARSMKDVTKVVVADGVKHIGNYAFYGALHASEIEIADSVTSIGKCGIGGTGFTHVEIPASVTSVGIQLFHSMKNLQSFTIEGAITNVTSVDSEEVLERNYTIISDSPNVKTAYCEEKAYSFCFRALSNDRASKILKTYSKSGDVYIFDGKRYKSIADYEKGKEIKRIYTIDEANAVTKPTGNTVRIKYR